MHLQSESTLRQDGQDALVLLELEPAHGNVVEFVVKEKVGEVELADHVRNI